jgi:VCBS repeat protein
MVCRFLSPFRLAYFSLDQILASRRLIAKYDPVATIVMHTHQEASLKSIPRITALALLAGSLAGALQAQTLTFGRRTSAGNTTYTHIDLNNDGREDLVYPTVSASGPNGFTVVLSNGNGTYAAPVFYPSPTGAPANVLVMDINNDGYPDIFAWTGGAQFYEYLNNKSGAFQLQATFVTTTFVNSMVAGDFNHDGFIDLAYLLPAGVGPKGGTIHVLFNNHASGFSVGPVTTTAAHGQMEVGDFDGDGKADIFIQGDGSSVPSTICYGDNAGHFAAQTNANTAHSPFLFPMDIDGDGKTDLVGAGENFIENTHQFHYYKDLFVVYGTANRTVTETAVPLQGYPVPTVTGSGFIEPVADQADFNGDGKADLVLVEATQVDGGGARKVVVLTGKGSRAFNPEQTLYTDNSGALDFTVQAIRANSDNKPDILADLFVNNSPTAIFFLNDTSARFPRCPLPASATGIHLCSPTTYTSTKDAFSLSATGVPLMHRMELWVDGVKKYQQFARDFSHSAFLDTTLTLAVGTHKVGVYAAGQDNSLQRKNYTITVK